MKKVNEIILTDMMDCTIVPQMVGRMIEEYDKEQDRFICKTLTELNIDENILANQAKEIQRLNNLLQEYKDLEEQGLLLRLPCKVGTEKIYVIDQDKDIYYLIADEVTIKRFPKGTIVFEYDSYEFAYEDFGKTVFLTREEAEKKLQELQGNE